jgi:hypothetical protein
MAKKLIRFPPGTEPWSGKLKPWGAGLASFSSGGGVPEECCCPAEIQTCCCETPTASTLTWTFGGDGTGVYADLNGRVITLLYKASVSNTCEETANAFGHYTWEAANLPIVYNGGACSFDDFQFVCDCILCPDSGNWNHFVSSAEGGECGNDAQGPDTVVCDPFSATGVLAANNMAADTISYTVTE